MITLEWTVNSKTNTILCDRADYDALACHVAFRDGVNVLALDEDGWPMLEFLPR